jgi:hypothetical protein
MRRTDRIDLLRRLADHLADEEALGQEDRDLVLRQFELPAPGLWNFNGTLREYVLSSLEDGSEETLVELDEYLLGGSSREALEPSDLPWVSGNYRLFISHTHEHAALAGDVRTFLARWNIDAFVAHTTIEPTREWMREIEAALGSCDALAVFLTDDFVSSKWCDQEVGYCLARHIPVVPVKLHADPHGFISKFQAATPHHDSATWVTDAIFRALAGHGGAAHAMATPIAYRYALSGSFDGARGNFELLQKIPGDAWTRELVDMVERAPEGNRQIEHAGLSEGPFAGMSVPEAAAAVLEPIRERLGMNVAPLPPLADDDIPF